MKVLIDSLLHRVVYQNGTFYLVSTKKEVPEHIIDGVVLKVKDFKEIIGNKDIDTNIDDLNVKAIAANLNKIESKMVDKTSQSRKAKIVRKQEEKEN